MIDDGINPLGGIILVLSARESADGTEKYRKGNVRFKMMRTDECGLDVSGFVFVFHVIESHQNRRFQRFFVIGNKNVVNALFFLLKGSASVFCSSVMFLTSSSVTFGCKSNNLLLYSNMVSNGYWAMCLSVMVLSVACPMLCEIYLSIEYGFCRYLIKNFL